MTVNPASPGHWNDGLTRQQEIAASHVGTHARLLAGPGTGKTHALIRRVVWLVVEKQISPDNILVLTFTRAAAAELRRLVKGNLDPLGLGLPKVSTLHSFALRQILRNEGMTSLPRPLRIADDYEERYVVVEDLKKLLHRSVDDVEDLLNKLSADWQELNADKLDWEKRFPNPKFLGGWREHRTVYGYTLRSELVYRLKQLLLENGADVDLEGPPMYVMIDEYQDLNACDLEIIKSLSAVGSEIFCAGDDDQSIYGFRYANPEGIRRFPKDYVPSKDFVLDLCHRCGKNILEYGNFVAEQDPRRIAKQLHCGGKAGKGEVHLLRFFSGKQEADGIARICSSLIRTNCIQPENILILIRTDTNRWYSGPIETALAKAGISVATVSDPLGPLNSPSGRRVLCLMRLVVHPRDHLSWRVLLSQEEGIGDSTLAALYDMSVKNGWGFSETLRRVSSAPTMLPRRGEFLTGRISSIESLLARIGTPDDNHLEEWLSNVTEEVIEDPADRTSVTELFRSVIESSGSMSLSELLRNLNSSLGDKEQEREIGKVAIMTMHQAKGLTADAVILAGAEDELIPGRNKRDEDRRLLYVSLTRAKKHLYVTYCQKRLPPQSYTGRTPGKTDRTLTELLSGGPYPPENGHVFCRSIQ
jgi:DNA helicase-2/ATP-dependent DNA helicase PcrA